MKIINVEVINLHCTYEKKRYAYAGGRNTGKVTSLVLVTADNGMVGIGSAYSHPELVRIVVEGQFKPFLIGEDPTEVEKLWDKMVKLTQWYGRKGAAISALGGVDIALWDLRGKALNKPIYELLGSKRTEVPAYASGLLWEDTLEELADEAARHVEQGYRRVKMRLGRSLDEDVAAVRAVRRAVGPSIDVIVDASMRYSLDVAVRIGKVLEEERVFWYEEPFLPEDIDNYAELRRHIKVKVAAGENEFGLAGFRELFRAGAVDIAQPDACRAGGLTVCWQVGKLAAEFGLGIATHTWSDAVAVMANAHVVAALDNGITVEIDRTGNPFIDELLVEPLQVRNGLLPLSGKPGLGIELNMDAVRRYTLPAGQSVPEGNYFDMVFGTDTYHVSPPYEG